MPEACEKLYARAARIAGQLAAGESREAFAKLPDGRQVFYRFFNGGDPEKTVVVLNGLVYNGKNWTPYLKSIKEKGYSVLQIFFSGHPESLRALKGNAAELVKKSLTPELLAEEVDAAVQSAGLKGKFHLLTLSYGAVGVEYARLQRDRLKDVTFMAPLVRPTDQYKAEGQAFQNVFDAYSQMAGMMDPFGIFGGRRSVEATREAAYRQAVAAIVSGNTPELPKGVSPEMYREGVLNLVMGAREFDLKKFATSELPRVNLLVASEEGAPELADQLRFWELLPEDKKGSLVRMQGAAHAMVGSHPGATSDVTIGIWDGSLEAGEHEFDAQKRKLIQQR